MNFINFIIFLTMAPARFLYCMAERYLLAHIIYFICDNAIITAAIIQSAVLQYCKIHGLMNNINLQYLYGYTVSNAILCQHIKAQILVSQNLPFVAFFFDFFSHVQYFGQLLIFLCNERQLSFYIRYFVGHRFFYTPTHLLIYIPHRCGYLHNNIGTHSEYNIQQ